MEAKGRVHFPKFRVKGTGKGRVKIAIPRITTKKFPEMFNKNLRVCTIWIVTNETVCLVARLYFIKEQFIHGSPVWAKRLPMVPFC
jgi:ABC-type ATPase with predicted acetyltransferase domain